MNVGDVLAGKYQVERVLGVGGMGVVVAAKHVTLGERVAIKFLLPEALTRADVVARFLREGQAAARLRGEHVARVHDVGKLETGAPFLVMEYLDGKDLGALLREEGPLPVAAAVDYLLQACEALAEAHSAGIVHRDLKPGNLFVVKRLDGSPSIKLIDFGISKILLPGTEGGEGDMTATAVMMGSPYYMAPEQMASARDVDGRADIWSLGVILYTLLAGNPPFRAPSVMQIYEQILKGAPRVRDARGEVPEGVEAAILHCLEKDRTLRFADVGELASAIAPHGSADAPGVADRIKRILAARANRESQPLPSTDAPVPVASVTPAASAPRSPSAPTPSSEAQPKSAPSEPSAPALDPAATGGPWDQKTRPPSRRSRPIALAATGVALLVGVPIAFFALRSGDPPKPTAGAVSESASAPPAPPSAEPAAPAVQPAPADPAASGAASTNAAAPSASASASASARARADAPPSRRTPPPATTPPPRGAPRTKPGDDLFGTQK